MHERKNPNRLGVFGVLGPLEEFIAWSPLVGVLSFGGDLDDFNLLRGFCIKYVHRWMDVWVYG